MAKFIELEAEVAENLDIESSEKGSSETDNKEESE